MLDSEITTDDVIEDEDQLEELLAQHPFASREIAFDETPRAVEYVIDQFLPLAFTVFAAAHGQGKTTVLVWLVLAVCGAIKVKGLDVKVCRDIVYLTEDPDQLMRLVVETVSQWDGSMEVVHKHFHIFQARRDSKEDYQQLAEYIRGKWPRTRPHLVTKIQVTIEPVIVLDTASACLAVDNENDNSEVAEAVSMLRSFFRCVILVSHVAKNLSRKDPELITARGGGAWVADAQHEMVLFEENGHRFLYADYPRKRRDAGEIREIKIETAIRTAEALDSFGHKAVLRTRIVAAMQLSDKSARKSETARIKNKEDRRQQLECEESVMAELRSTQLARISAPSDIANYYSQTQMEAKLMPGMTREVIRSAIEALIESGKVQRYPLPKDRIKPKPKHPDYLDICSPEDEDE